MGAVIQSFSYWTSQLTGRICWFNTICAVDAHYQVCGCTQNMLCLTKSLIVRVPFRIGVKLCVTQPEHTHNAAPLSLPFPLENVTSEWQCCWMLLLLAAAYVGMLSRSFGPSLPCALQQCWSQWIKTFRGETRVICEELFALLSSRLGGWRRLRCP